MQENPVERLGQWICCRVEIEASDTVPARALSESRTALHDAAIGKGGCCGQVAGAVTGDEGDLAFEVHGLR